MNLQIFENKEFGKVRTIVKNGEPLFIAKDVCDILGLSNSRQAVSRLDNDEKNTVTLNDGIGNPNKTVVNEYGLYNLVLASRKPQAKAFKRWITHDVIPAIRKTGKYEVQQQTLNEEQYKPSVKYYRGIPVVTKMDVAMLLGVDRSVIQAYIRRPWFMIENVDFFFLRGRELVEFRRENGICYVITSLLVLTESGVRKIYEARMEEFKEDALFPKPVQLGAGEQKLVVDVPVNLKIQDNIKALRKKLTALDETLLRAGERYYTHDRYNAFITVIEALGADIALAAVSIRDAKANLISLPEGY